MRNIQLIIFPRKMLQYIGSSEIKYDPFFYLLFIVQISLLPSIPSGYHSPNLEGWFAFFISMIFSFVFYPSFFFAFYKIKGNEFIREIVLLSVVARIYAFILVGIVAVLQIALWSYLELPKFPNLSLVYYLLYYSAFTWLMVLYKKSTIEKNV